MKVPDPLRSASRWLLASHRRLLVAGIVAVGLVASVSIFAAESGPSCLPGSTVCGEVAELTVRTWKDNLNGGSPKDNPWGDRKIQVDPLSPGAGTCGKPALANGSFEFNTLANGVATLSNCKSDYAYRVRVVLRPGERLTAAGSTVASGDRATHITPNVAGGYVDVRPQKYHPKDIYFTIALAPTPPPPPPAAACAPLHRMYHPPSNQHFYTNSEQELGYAKNAGWSYEKDEGFTYGTQASGTVPLHRLALVQGGQFKGYYLTPSDAEADAAVRYGWVRQGNVGFVNPTQVQGTVPLHGLIYFANGDYKGRVYTTSDEELASLKAGGWIHEREAGFLRTSCTPPNPNPTPTPPNPEPTPTPTASPTPPAKGNINATVFEDKNGNGTREEGETAAALPSFDITTACDTAGEPPTGNTTAKTVRTVNGAAAFTEILPGPCSVTILVPANSEYKLTTTNTHNVTVQANKTENVEYGLKKEGPVTPGTHLIIVKAVEDTNGNCTAEAADVKFGNVPVTLTGPSGTSSATTGPNGEHTFAELSAGTYTVKATTVTGYELCPPDSRDLTVNPSVGNQETTYVLKKKAETEAGKGKITVKTFEDKNGNCTFDNGDKTLANVPFAISGASEATGKTEANGQSMSEVPFGTYMVTASTLNDFTLCPPESQSATLTSTKPNQEVTFVLKKGSPPGVVTGPAATVAKAQDNFKNLPATGQSAVVTVVIIALLAGGYYGVRYYAKRRKK